MIKPTLSRTFVLNVKAFTQRRFFMEEQLKRVNLNAEFIFDWDVDDLTPTIIDEFFTTDNTLSLAQKSCALKHVSALQKAANTNGLSLILEDDAVFNSKFNLGLDRALTQSTQFPGDKVIFIGSGGNFFTPKSLRTPNQHLYIGERGRFGDSYILDSTTAQKRLDWIAIHKIAQSIDNQFEAIDNQLAIQTIWLEDPVVEQGSKNGLFLSSLEKAPPLWLKALLFHWEKIKRKHIYQIWR
jgi:glycosyl transferase family 25